MAAQFSTALRNAQADLIETTIGTAPRLEFFTGAPPANCAAADSGTKVAEGTLPSDWLTAASNGAVSKNGTWSFVGISGAGAGAVIGHYRIKDSAGTTCHHQGTVTDTGGDGDMTVNNTNVANGQNGSVATWSATVGGA